MAAPEIVPPVIWGSTAPGGVGVVGSLANGTPTLSTNPATVAGQTNFLTGWGATAVGYYPALQDLDGQAFYITSQLDGVIRQGIPQWNSGITYYTNGFCSYAGQIYVSLQDANLNQSPALGSAYWTLISSSTKGENAIRNGSMSIAQRGTSGTITASTPAYTLDGWIVDSVGANTAWSQVYYGPSNGFNLKLVPAGTLTDLYVKQRIESTQMSQVGYQNQTFQALITNNTGGSITPTITLNVPTVADNYGSVTQILAPTNLQTIANGASAVVSYTFSLFSTADANGLEVILDFGSSVPSGGNVLITDVDVSPTPAYTTGLNNKPPAYKSRFVAQELLNCQRYFQNYGGIQYQPLGFGWADATASPTTSGIVFMNLIAPMRTAPTATVSAASDFDCFQYNTAPPLSTFVQNVAGSLVSSNSALAFSFAAGSAVFIDNTPVFLRCANSTGSIKVSAEL